MNCQPNDLAVVVRTDGIAPELVGAIVTVVEVHTTADHGTLCMLKTPLPWVPSGDFRVADGSIVRAGESLLVCTLPDAVLQPIRGIPATKKKTRRVLTPAAV